MNRENRSLIQIDASAIRKKTVEELKAILDKIDEAKLNIKIYKQKEKPAFVDWYSSELLDLINKVESLEKKYATKEHDVREVFAYAEFYQIPATQAYLRVIERRNTPEDERDFDAFYDEEEKGYWETDEDPFSDWEKNQKNNSSEDGEDSDSDTESEDKNSKIFKNKKLNETAGEIVKVFRTIARFLHPDKNTDKDTEDNESWLAAMEHYNNKNLDALKDILTWVRIKKEDTGDEVSVGELMSLQKKSKKDLKVVQKELKFYKKHPDWDFRKKTKNQKKKMRKELEEDLQSEFIRIHYEMEKLDRVLFSWKEYANRLSSSHYRFFQD
ncbi:hypothetical protein [Leptospira sp. GIMC2001]|uniref:hypothetical protein n=1 Tax=Leptospira sp. GIMC2001 TaxID=1513297 RepID=UPI00234951F5|nr:hypothetical protein [Leptospira sp. GIMC2001]WCL50268.1 hypothetical protein O4O04_05450 [Leptospira sp. GIMC2001]